MHVHHSDPGAIVAEVNVVGDDPRLVGVDKVDQFFHAQLQLLERPRANIRRVDVHDHVRAGNLG
jgi:hypothetical protein